MFRTKSASADPHQIAHHSLKNLEIQGAPLNVIMEITKKIVDEEFIHGVAVVKNTLIKRTRV